MIPGNLSKLIVHYVGNKRHEEGLRFSTRESRADNIEGLMGKLLGSCFQTEELFQFFFMPKLDLNPVYYFVRTIFRDPSTFVAQSQHIGRYLYEKSTHPQIKGAELCVVYLKDCQLKGEKADCIGFFKGEADAVLKIERTAEGFEVGGETGLSISKLDKGCLVFNIQSEEGFLVSVVDNKSRQGEANYWKNEFLSVRPLSNAYHHTHEFLNLTRQFVTRQLPMEQDTPKPDQIDLLNRSVDYFKAHEQFQKEDFEQQVLQEEGLIESFKHFDYIYRSEHDLTLPDQFDISSQAVKKQTRAFRSVLKLDKNFHVYIHGDRELIERGREKDGRKYYKLYYEQES